MPEENEISAQDNADYEFVLAELERVNTAGIEAMLAHYCANPLDAAYSLDGPRGQSVNFTRAGYLRLSQIVERRLAGSPVLQQRFTKEKLVKQLSAEFLARIRDGWLEHTEAAALFDAAVTAERGRHREVTHFIPCAVVAHAQPAKFSIGPVIFHRRELFWRDAEPQIRNLLTDSPEMAETFLSGLRNFYGSYWWVAEIRVPPCDKEISWLRATRIVQKCLDLLKLRIGSGRAAHIHQAYDSALPHDQSHLRQIGGVLDFSVGGAEMHDAVLNDDWFSQITDPMWKLAESFIQAYWDGWDRAPNELQQRFMDGMSWHSDAVSESDITAQIVKYWTAIERVATVRRNDDAKKNAALLLSENAVEFALATEKTQRLYRCRNAIVHGLARRGDKELEHDARESEELSQKVLFSYLWLIRGAPANIAPDCARNFMRDLFAQWETHFKNTTPAKK